MKKTTFLFFILNCLCCILRAQTGIINTIAGTGASGYSTGGTGKLATLAMLNSDGGVAVDDSGNVYIADGSNNRIRKVNSSGVISTIAGNGVNGYSGDGGQATAAELSNPTCVRVDTLGNIYLSDEGNSLIRKIIPSSGTITTIAGNYNFGDGYSGDGGQATLAELNEPYGICVDKNLNVYYADKRSNVVREIAYNTGIITTVAGNGISGYSGNGGYATAAELFKPTGVAVDKNTGNLYIADYGNNEVRIVNTGDTINRFTGNGFQFLNYFYGSLYSNNISLNPVEVSTDALGNVYIADDFNSVIWEAMIADSMIYVIAGNSNPGYSGDGGPALNAELQNPFDVAVDAGNNVYIADQGNNVVRKVTATCSDTTSTYVYNPIQCSGEADGGIGAYSNSPYISTYYWSSNVGAYQQTSPYVNGLSAGTYTVTITDVFGCTASSSATLTQPSGVALGVSILSVSNVSCFGGTGTATANSATGGTPPYTYYWTGYGGTNLTTMPLFAGTYTLYVNDSNSCYSSAVATITQPAFPLGITISSVTNVSCYNGNGSATADTATGGTSPYTYSWSPGGGTNLTTIPVGAGTYTISVTDNHGCTALDSAIITQPAFPLGITIASQTNIICNGTGSATANAAAGGTSPYTYSWSGGGGANLAATNLSAGTYSITASDNNGCTATASVTITQLTSVSISISSQMNVVCNGESNGSATANATTGGTPPYTYSWTPGGGTSLTISNLIPGIYIITATDRNGCFGTASVTITQPNILAVSESSINVSCNGGNTGSSSATPAGGTFPYTFSWSNGAISSSISTLSAGIYIIKVTDYHGCTVTSSVTITQPPPLTANSAVISNNSCKGDSAGRAAVSVGGGTGVYIYSWAPSGGNSNIANGLSAGTYTVTVTDGNNCIATATVTITQPLLALRYKIIDTIQNSGSCTGAATISASGGTVPYTYFWWPSGQTGATATNLCAGTKYCCTVTDNNGCTGNDSCYLVTTVGIEDITNASDINIYPDPNNGYFTVDGLWRGQVMELYNYLGQKVMSLTADEITAHINISDQPNGIYLILITTGDGTLVKEQKIVKIQ